MLLLLLAPSSFAAVTANSIVTAQTPNNGKLQIIAAAQCTGSGAPAACCTGSGTGCAAGTYFTLYTAGTNGSKCNAISVANDDPSATHVITFEVINGSNTYHYSTLTTTSPASGSYSTANAASITNWTGLPTDSDGNPYLLLVNGDILKATFATAITSSDEIDLFASCADF